MVCPPRAAVLGSRTRVDAYNRSITKPLTGEPDAGRPPVGFGGRGLPAERGGRPIDTAWLRAELGLESMKHNGSSQLARSPGAEPRYAGSNPSVCGNGMG